MTKTHPAAEDAPLTHELARYLDQLFSDYPILVIDATHRRLVACYARVDIEVALSDACTSIVRTDSSPNRFLAPSTDTALAFLAAVEAIRQSTTLPMLYVQTGLGPSSNGNAVCM